MREPDVVRLNILAHRLRDLHRPGDPLLLVNAWDVASAKAIESAGAAAVATSSAAIAQAHGRPDNNTGSDAAFETARMIAGNVGVPVTVDLEGGYGLSGRDLVDRLLHAGSVGCNIEDTDHVAGGLVDADEHASYLADVRAAAVAAGVAVVVNARIDTIIQHPQRDAAATLTETARRARLYIAAGADCVYPIGLTDPAIVKELVDELGVPINANPSPLRLPALAAAGAARISTGAGTYRFMIADLARRAGLMFAGSPEAFS